VLFRDDEICFKEFVIRFLRFWIMFRFVLEHIIRYAIFSKRRQLIQLEIVYKRERC